MQLLAMGYAVMDKILLIRQLPKTNQNAESLGASYQYGGKVATASVAAARMGVDCGIIFAAGGVTGELVRKDLDRHGIDTSRAVVREGRMSQICMCIAERTTGGRSFMWIPTTLPAPEDPAPEELDREYALQADVLLINDLDPGAKAMATWFKEAGKTVVIDADGYTEAIDKNMDLVDIFIGSEFFYKHIFGEDVDYEKNLRMLKQKMKNEKAIVIITLGEAGLVGLDEEGKYFSMPCFDVDVVDTTGAGDVFHGAYIAAMLKGMDVKQSCRYASAASAVKCTRLGGRAGIPTHEQVLEFLSSGKTDFAELDERVEYYRYDPMMG